CSGLNVNIFPGCKGCRGYCHRNGLNLYIMMEKILGSSAPGNKFRTIQDKDFGSVRSLKMDKRKREGTGVQPDWYCQSGRTDGRTEAAARMVEPGLPRGNDLHGKLP